MSLACGIAAADDTRAKLTQALSLVEAARFEQAVPLLRELLAPPVVKGNDLRAARIAYAQALFYTGQKKQARAELKLLFKKFPAASIDETAIAPDFVELFNEIRANEIRGGDARPDPSPPAKHKQAERPSKPEPQARVDAAATKPVVAPDKPEPAAEPGAATPSAPKEIAVAPATIDADAQPIAITSQTHKPAPWYLKMLPFGVGQFANKDYAVGGVLLALELGLLATNIAMIVLNRAAQNADGSYQPGTSPALYVAQQVSAGGLYLTLGFGLLDAFLWSPGRGEARAQRQ